MTWEGSLGCRDGGNEARSGVRELLPRMVGQGQRWLPRGWASIPGPSRRSQVSQLENDRKDKLEKGPRSLPAEGRVSTDRVPSHIVT